MKFDGYETEGFYDELFRADGVPRLGADLLVERINSLPESELQRRQLAAEKALLTLGITFNVYGNESQTEKIFPFDIVPRIIQAAEWKQLEIGLKQRISALNSFIHDVYNDQKIIKDGIVPADLVASADGFREQCIGIDPPCGVWCHITGTDLVRDGSGEYFVLEDNLRCPSGVSYVLENRQLMKWTFPLVFGACSIKPVTDYPSRLLEMLQEMAPPAVPSPNVVVWTPGIYNSAYFEHSYLAQQMGVSLVEGSDLVVHRGEVKMRTTKGLERVDVIYRRVDDEFMDPRSFRKDSLLGVPGLMQVYKKGRVALANAPGTGVADDKAIYAYVPQIIKYYLGEDPIINNVPTYACWRADDCKYVLDNLDKLVVKAVNEAGGYGMLIGPHSTRAEQDEFARRIKASPRTYIAQPTLALSRVPVMVDDHFEGRHVDLRPYILYGARETYVVPGGLTRVALKKGSLVVNSSQGGGSKDTWVLNEADAQGPESDAQTEEG